MGPTTIARVLLLADLGGPSRFRASRVPMTRIGAVAVFY